MKWPNKYHKLKIFFTRLRGYQPRDEAGYLYWLSALVGVTALGLAVWFGVGRLGGARIGTPPIDHTPVSDEEPKCLYRRTLDGLCVETARHVDPPLVTVMVENNHEAWPLSGLSAARVVYEAPVEGDIPRFMAVYAGNDDVDEVGPVRSARPYYLDWVSEYGTPLYMHVGGSSAALLKIVEHEIFDIDEFSRGRYFWRDKKRAAPHNTYTSGKLWRKADDDYRQFYKKEPLEGWTFTDYEPCEAGCIERVSVPFGASSYTATWVYSTSTNQFMRFQGGSRQYDRDQEPIVADTVDEAGRELRRRLEVN